MADQVIQWAASCLRGKPEVIIANRGEPVALLVPVAAVNREGTLLHWLRDNPLPDYAQRTHAERSASC